MRLMLLALALAGCTYTSTINIAADNAASVLIDGAEIGRVNPADQTSLNGDFGGLPGL